MDQLISIGGGCSSRSPFPAKSHLLPSPSPSSPSLVLPIESQSPWEDHNGTFGLENHMSLSIQFAKIVALSHPATNVDLQVGSKNRCLGGSRSIDSVPKEGKARKGVGDRTEQEEGEGERGSSRKREGEKQKSGRVRQKKRRHAREGVRPSGEGRSIWDNVKTAASNTHHRRRTV